MNVYTYIGDRMVATRVYPIPLRRMKTGGTLKAHARLIYSKSKNCWGNNARQRAALARANRLSTLEI